MSLMAISNLFISIRLRPILLGHESEIGGHEGEGIDHQKRGTASV